jgi:hypothetical protein
MGHGDDSVRRRVGCSRQQAGIGFRSVHCDIGAFERSGKWLPIMLVE